MRPWRAAGWHVAYNSNSNSSSSGRGAGTRERACMQGTLCQQQRQSPALWCCMLLCWQLLGCTAQPQAVLQAQLGGLQNREVAISGGSSSNSSGGSSSGSGNPVSPSQHHHNIHQGPQQAPVLGAQHQQQHRVLRAPAVGSGSRDTTANASATASPAALHNKHQQQQQQWPQAQQESSSRRRLLATQQQLRVVDSRQHLLPGHDFDPTAAIYMRAADQQQQQQQHAEALVHPDLASSEAEVAAAAVAVVAAVGDGAAAQHHTGSAEQYIPMTAADTIPAAAAAAAAAREAPPPTAPAPAPAVARAQHSTPQHGTLDSSSDDFMTEDDYSIAYAGGRRADRVQTAAQAAALAATTDVISGAEGFIDDSGFTDDGDADAFHDDEAEAAAAAAAAAATAAAAPAPAAGGGGGGSSDGSGDVPWTPEVLATPVPKYPRLYGTMPLSPNSIVGKADRLAARQALEAAVQAATSPQGTTFGGITGLSLEDKILMARLLGNIVSGTFDAAGRLDPVSAEYWELLDKQLEAHPIVKHMFEPTWYKCRKLHPELAAGPVTAEQLEAEAHQHILNWLGIHERQLPRPGEVADFDELLALLGAVGAMARIVTDPVPFLTTSHVPLDRSGIPLLVHMTFKNKGRFSRYHMIAVVSWARANPDHAILMYDDADLLAYIRTFDEGGVELYTSLQTAVERSDLWRYSVMCKHGGAYTDADTLCVRPIQEWNQVNANDAEVMFGVEDVFKRDPNGGGNGWGVTSGRIGLQFQQWTLVGAPSHPVHCNMPDLIKQRMAEEETGRPPPVDAENWLILHRTGPHVWTDSVLQWMHNAGVGFQEALVPGGRLVNTSARVMPSETFGCAAHFFSPKAQLEGVFAMHMFRGVWRKRFNDVAQAHLEVSHASPQSV